ncbi:MAG: hypothetical protein MJA29_14195, partial [Candidatus Omnitrophica bacterium]|nr:hypothetical protein [Candidatus Omnitrophota bacterium]
SFSSFFGTSAVGSAWLTKYACDEHTAPSTFYADETATALVGRSSDGYQAFTVGTSNVNLAGNGVAFTAHEYRCIEGKSITLFIVLYDAGSDLTLAGRVSFAATDILTDFISVATSTDYKLYKLPPIVLPSLADIAANDYLDFDRSLGFASINVVGKRTTGSADVRVDFQTMFLDVTQIEFTGAASKTGVIYKHPRTCISMDPSNKQFGERYNLFGSPLSFTPGLYNHLMVLHKAELEDDIYPVASTFYDIDRLYLHPRYLII